jgi:hypothetical protein
MGGWGAEMLPVCDGAEFKNKLIGVIIFSLQRK